MLTRMMCLAFDRAGQDTADEVALQGEEHHQWQGHGEESSGGQQLVAFAIGAD